jgi:hypothetical protein
MPSKQILKFPSELERKTIELYARLPRNVRDTEIAEATGLTSGWISMFVSGKSRFADTGRIEALYRYCSGKTLFES